MTFASRQYCIRSPGKSSCAALESEGGVGRLELMVFLKPLHSSLSISLCHDVNSVLPGKNSLGTGHGGAWVHSHHVCDAIIDLFALARKILLDDNTVILVTKGKQRSSSPGVIPKAIISDRV